MAFIGKICAFVVLAILAYAVHEVHSHMHTGMMHYASLTAGDNFELKWTYKNNMLHFKMKCKGEGWCGVGFSTVDPGARMVQYDIAAGGVDANMTGYLSDYWSNSAGAPTPDANQNLTLVNATQSGGYTMVEFYRPAMTGDAADVQFSNDTDVWMMWGLHGTKDANMGLTDRHTSFGRMGAPQKYNLIMMAMNAGMTTPVPTPTPTSAASQLGLRVVMFSILSLASCVLSSF